jgi:hypothetical protein
MNDRTLVGLVCAHNGNRRDGFVCLAGVCAVPFTRTGLCAESLLLLAEHVFGNGSVREVHLDAPALNYEQFASGAERFFTEEARLQDHTYHDGRCWDLIVGSLTTAGMEAIADLRRRRRTLSPGDDRLMDVDGFCAEPGVVVDPGRDAYERYLTAAAVPAPV